jgi:hypothetical protein
MLVTDVVLILPIKPHTISCHAVQLWTDSLAASREGPGS